MGSSALTGIRNSERSSSSTKSSRIYILWTFECHTRSNGDNTVAFSSNQRTKGLVLLHVFSRPDTLQPLIQGTLTGVFRQRWGHQLATDNQQNLSAGGRELEEKGRNNRNQKAQPNLQMHWECINAVKKKTHEVWRKILDTLPKEEPHQILEAKTKGTATH